jgi:hypothetical protein
VPGPGDHQVDVAAPQRRHDLDESQLAHGQVDAVRAGDQRREIAGERAPHERHGDPSAAHRGGRASAQPLRRRQRLLRVLERHHPGRRQRRAARGARQQLDAELGLQRADVAAHLGLREPEPQRGAAEVQLLGDCHEGPQVLERNVHALQV